MTQSKIQAGLIEWLKVAKSAVGMYVTLTDLYMLCVICHRHSIGKPIILSELAKSCGCSPSTASRTIAFLSDVESDSLGLVKQIPSATDRRQETWTPRDEAARTSDMGCEARSIWKRCRICTPY